MRFKVTFTHCPHHGGLACQQKRLMRGGSQLTLPCAHTNIVSHVWLFGGFVVVFFYIIRICSLYRNALAERHSHHSMCFVVILVPTINLTNLSFHVGIIEKKLTYLSHHSGWDGMKALCGNTAPVKFSRGSLNAGWKQKHGAVIPAVHPLPSASTWLCLLKGTVYFSKQIEK